MASSSQEDGGAGWGGERGETNFSADGETS